jgi:hypothetical protein
MRNNAAYKLQAHMKTTNTNTKLVRQCRLQQDTILLLPVVWEWWCHRMIMPRKRRMHGMLQLWPDRALTWPFTTLHTPWGAMQTANSPRVWSTPKDWVQMHSRECNMLGCKCTLGSAICLGARPTNFTMDLGPGLHGKGSADGGSADNRTISMALPTWICWSSRWLW